MAFQERARAGQVGQLGLLRLGALVAGAAFLLVGVLGFIPGITTDYDQLGFAGPDSDAKLLGLFEVSVLHNIVHILFGAVGLAASRTVSAAGSFLIGAGVIYLVLWLYGLFVGDNTDANFVPLNTADDWLHFVLGAGMLAIGFMGRRRP